MTEPIDIMTRCDCGAWVEFGEWSIRWTGWKELGSNRLVGQWVACKAKEEVCFYSSALGGCGPFRRGEKLDINEKADQSPITTGSSQDAKDRERRRALDKLLQLIGGAVEKRTAHEDGQGRS